MYPLGSWHFFCSSFQSYQIGLKSQCFQMFQVFIVALKLASVSKEFGWVDVTFLKPSE